MAAELAAETPQIDPQYDWIWRAWSRLSRSRHYVSVGITMAMGAVIIMPRPLDIHWSAIMEWADRHGLNDDDRELLDVCIQAMDQVHAEIWVEQNKVKA